MAHICQRCKKEIAPGDGVDLGMNAEGVFFHAACWSRQKAKDAICNDELIRDEATAHEMRLDSDALGILVGNLMTALQDLWDLEKKYALRKAVVLRKFRINADV